MEQKKTTFSDLNTPLKIGIIAAYIYLTIMLLAFLIGLIEGILGL